MLIEVRGRPLFLSVVVTVVAAPIVAVDVASLVESPEDQFVVTSDLTGQVRAWTAGAEAATEGISMDN